MITEINAGDIILTEYTYTSNRFILEYILNIDDDHVYTFILIDNLEFIKLSKLGTVINNQMNYYIHNIHANHNKL